MIEVLAEVLHAFLGEKDVVLNIVRVYGKTTLQRKGREQLPTTVASDLMMLASNFQQHQVGERDPLYRTWPCR